MVEAVMTDYQFKSIMKMALKIIEASEDKDSAVESIREIINDKKEKNPD